MLIVTLPLIHQTPLILTTNTNNLDTWQSVAHTLISTNNPNPNPNPNPNSAIREPS